MASYHFDPINILDTSNASGVGSGGSLTLGGGISIGKDTFIGGNLNVSGTNTTFVDNLIVLNANPTASYDSGFLLQRYQTDVSNNDNYSGIVYSETVDEFIFGYATSDVRGAISLNRCVPIRTAGVNITGGSLNATFHSNTIGSIITTGGNVGINTTAPSFKLDVQGDIQLSGNFYKNGNVYSPGSQWTSFSNNIAFTSGNIGIGTTNPSSSLDVAGSAQVTNFSSPTATIGTLLNTNSVSTNITSATLNVSAGITTASAQITTATIGTLLNTNVVSTNVSTATLNVSTGITTASAQITTATIGTLLNTNVVSTNVSAASLTVSTGITTASAQITNANVTTATISNLLNTNLTIANVTVSNVTGGSISLSGNMNVAGNAVIAGDLTVAGTTTAINTNTTLIEDNLIVLNSGPSGLYDGGIMVQRTTGSFAALFYSAGNDEFQIVQTASDPGTSPVVVSSYKTLRLGRIVTTGDSNTIGSLITTGGNVGIGTTSPTVQLQVKGNSYFEDNVTIGSLFCNNAITQSITTQMGSYFSNAFTASNNVVAFSDVTGLTFSNSFVRSFVATITVIVNNSVGGNLYETFTLEGHRTDSSWSLLTSSFGDVSGISFSITSSGQVQYTSIEHSNWLNTTIRYTVSQINENGVYTNVLSPTSGTILIDSLQINNTISNALYSNGGATFQKSVLVASTSSSLGLGSGGSLTVLGGAAISKNIHIGNDAYISGGVTVGNINFIGTLYQNGQPYIGSQWTSGTSGSLYYTSGNVGIGTTNPTQKLHVEGQAVITTSISSGALLAASANVTNITAATLNATIGITTASAQITNANVTSITAGTLNASTGITTASAQITNANVSNITAGTLNASTGITTASAQITNANVSNITAGTLNALTGITTNISSATLNLSTGITTVSAQITAATITNETVGTTRITSNLIALGNSNTVGSIFTTGGNVGIGTTAPSSRLQVSNSFSIRDTITTGTSLDFLAGVRGATPFGGWTTIDPNNGTTGSAGVYIWDGLEVNGSTTLGNTIITGNTFINGGIYPNPNTTTASNFLLNVYGGTFTVNGPLSLSGYSIDSIGTVNATNATASIATIGTTRITSNLIAIGNSNTIGSLFTTAGNVGIGTTSPESKLHVNGAITLDGETVSYGPNTDTGSRTQTYIAFKPNGTDNDWAYLRQVGGSNQFLIALDIHDDGEEPGFCIRSVKSTDNPDTINERFRVQANGNVGIGTTSPSHTLDVNGSGRFSNLTVTNISTSSLLLTSDLSMDNGRVLTAKNASGTYETFLWPRWTDNVMYLNFGSNGFNIRNQASTTVMFMTSTGNVGIGNTTPSNRLDIASVARTGTHATGAPLYITGDIGSNASGVEIRHSNGTQGLGFGFNSIYAAGSNTNQDLCLFAKGIGNVGINTGSPSFTLDVSGTARVSTNLLAIGNSNTLGNIFTTGGNVGIGTASPGQRLEVSGKIRAINIGHSVDTENYSMEIVAPTSTGLLETSIRFHQEGRYWQQIRAYNTGFKFTQGDSSSLVNIEAGGIVGSTARVTTGITTGLLEITGSGVVDTPNLTVTTAASISSLTVSGTTLLDGGSIIVVQNSQDGGTGRGIYMWNLSDPNWGIYMGQSGATKSLGGGTACTGAGGFAQHAIRLRTANSASQGLIYENNSEACLFSVRASDGMSFVAGNFGVGNASPSFNLDVTGTARITTGITTGGLEVTGLSDTLNLTATNATISNLSVGTFSPTNISTTNITATNLISSLSMTSGNLQLNGGFRANFGLMVGTIGVLAPRLEMYSHNNNTNPMLQMTALGFDTGGFGIGAYLSNNVFTMNSTNPGWFIGSQSGVGFGIIRCTGTTGLPATTNIDFNINSNGVVSAGNVMVSNMTVSNLRVTAITNQTTVNNVITNETRTNLVLTNGTISNLTVTGGLFTGVASTTMTAGNFLVNQTITSGNCVVTGNLIAIGNSNTIGNIFTTGGNVGIGTTSPSQRLDVSGGVVATNIGSTFSTFGSLACPGTASTNIIIFQTLVGNNSTIGTLRVSSSLSKASGTFDIQHPNNATKRLVHSFIEGPRCDLIYRGKVNLINGSAVVNLDTDCVAEVDCAMTEGTFESLCANPQYWLQNHTSFNRVKGTIQGNILVIECENPNSSDTIYWSVIAERKDPHIKQWDRTNSNGYLVTEYI